MFQLLFRAMFLLFYPLFLASEEPNVWRLEENHNSVVAANLSVLSSFGEGLMETVCRDACSGHDIARVRKDRRDISE